ncbi:S1/P1 nuclease [Aequorivita echinoideorum]|uniref:S1/P1 nuclease n=1 Tax=Aequorivita echinoideorum TaxID=1549647 RepID=A0ABS5S544_9FLAO|nr:S1/P1 nuclease [Aequorivita echinoideorum]MBT0608342.1 S1/P1 nuclease [Aequorivita echinoideorum]
MKKYIFAFSFLIISVANLRAADDWGKTGHRVTGEIAEKYLSKKAKKEISKLLDAHSLAFVSNFGDDIKSDAKFDHFGPWHYVNFPFGARYEDSPKSEKGDIIIGINKCITILKDDRSSREDKVFYLKMLVHFMGDLHQPLHIGLAEDKGGNDFQVRWFGEGTNLHTVWDSSILESYQMSYSEISKNADVLSERQLEAIQKGTPLDWMYDSRKLCENIYENTKVGEKLGYEYMYKYMNVLRSQLQKGGIRLAALLNNIYG